MNNVIANKYNNVIANKYLEKYIFAGNAYFTLTSRKTNAHYTYNISKKKNAPVWFVKIQDGHSNVYSGYIKVNNGTYQYYKGNSGTYDMDDNRILSLMWFIRHINDTDIDNKIVLQHVGKCCKCGRKLTDPKSIELGIGPECMKSVY